MNHGIKRLLVTMSLAFCLFGTVFSTQVKAEDTNTGNDVVTYERKVRAYTAERVSKYLAGENSHPELDGYLFAGWYTDEKCDDTCYLGVNEPSGTMYALFIPKQVLGVQAQIKAALTDGDVTDDDTVTSLRFVTSVDSLNYREVGFYVTYEIGGQEYTSKSSSKKVYEELYYVDSTEGTMSVIPKGLFCNLSKYFKAGTVINVPESLYETEFTVQPFWVTMEGDVVKGDEVVKSVDIGCARDTVYVSSETDEEGNLIAQDKSYYGSENYPYASLDYAIAHVEDEGTVCVKDSLTVASSLTSWSAHGKSITITGYANDEDAETLIFDGNELSVKDSVTFSTLNLTFANYVYANGNNLTVSEDVTVESAKYIYGGGKENEVSDTCLKLYAGSYSIIYGGAHNGNVDGDTYVEIGPKVNPEAQYTQHDARNYLLYGGCRYGTVTGDTKVVVKDGAKIEHLYGGGNNSTTVVEGSTYVEFTGQAYSVYGGSFKGTNGSTHIKMTGGTAYQVFGGCEGNSMEGNTDVQVLGGTVKRRIYGGCYNADDNSWGTEYHVTGNIFVTIGTDAEVSLALDSENDNSLYALTRDSISYDSEKGVFIFNDYENSSSNISKIGPDSLVQFAGVSTKTHHYQVNATSGGTVSQAGDCIYIQPSDENPTATVRLDSESGSIVYYAEEAGYYPLPDLVDGTRQVFVTFSADEQTDFATNTAAARIGNVYYAELDSAVKAAEKMENAKVVGLNGTEDLAAITIETTGQGTVKTDKLFCQPTEVVTLTVNPKEGYYCSALSVTKDGEAVALNEEFALDAKTYTITPSAAGKYIVKATFVKKVFETPTSSKYTLWDVLEQNTSSEPLSNGGTKISGTISATTQSNAAGNNTVLTFADEYTNMDLTLTVKEDADNSVGNTPETRITYDFGDSRVFRISVYEYNGTVVIRENSSGVINKRLYAFTEDQEANYRSDKGVELRIVKIDTQIFLYIDGEECAIGAVNNGGNTTQYYTGTDIDLTDFYTDNPITANTPASVNIRRVGDEGSQIDMPYSIANEVTLVEVDINETTNGTVTADRAYYFAGDTVTLTVDSEEGYYCSNLIVKKDGEVIGLNKELTITGTTYTFEVEDGIYTVEVAFAKKVFTTPTSSSNTSWNVIRQNQSMKTLSNGGTKVSGTVVATDVKDGDSTDTLNSCDKYTEVDVTLTVKEGAIDSYSGTTAVFNFGSYVLQVRAVNYQGKGVVLRAVGGMSSTQNVYTFDDAQSEKYNSDEGVDVRFVRTGTELYAYVDGTQGYVFDLAALSVATNKTEVTASTTMNVGIKWFGDSNTSVKIPFTVVDTLLPALDVQETTNGTVTKDKTIYSVGDTATLTVTPDDGYYCSNLIVKKDGEKVALNEELTITGTTYTFEVEEGIYKVEAAFAKKVFTTQTKVTNTSWNVIRQNQSMETLSNGGTKVSGTVVATDVKDGDSTDTLNSCDKYTDVDVTLTVKEGATDSYSGTTAVFNFGSYVLQVRAVNYQGKGVVLRAVGGMSSTQNVYTFDDAQSEKYNSDEGVDVRFVRTGTELYAYVGGTQGYVFDLAALSVATNKTEVTASTTMNVGIKWFGDTNTSIEIPFTLTDKATPVTVEVYDEDAALVAASNVSSDTQNIDLVSNETYTVKVTTSGMTSDGYCKITYVDYVTNETQIVYTPAIAAGESFEFTYKNGVFDSETEAEIATILWENRIKATKDVLSVEVINGEPEGTTIEANAILGREPMAKPASETVSTSWTPGYAVSTTGKITEDVNYAYTDVITVAKKGTKLSFIDSVKTDSWATGDVLVVSSWKQDENEAWVIDTEGTNIAGQYTTGEITCTEGYEVFIERYGTDNITYTYITSEDNENIRFCYFAGEGTTSFPKITQTYSGETGTAVEIALAEDTSTWLENDKARAYYSIFEGKTISVIGDSYMAGSSIADTSDIWVNMFAAKYGMTINNHGVNGSTISNYAGDKYNPMVDRWATDFENDTPDIIIVEGGRNDYNYNTPMGEIGTTDKGTMKGATTYLISSLKEKYPDAIIIGITCWEVGGNKNAVGYYCSDYGRAFIEVCENLEIPYVNAMDSEAMNVYMTSSNFRGRFCIKAGDVSHLNEKGMKLVLPIFEEKIYNICK